MLIKILERKRDTVYVIDLGSSDSWKVRKPSLYLTDRRCVCQECLFELHLLGTLSHSERISKTSTLEPVFAKVNGFVSDLETNGKQFRQNRKLFMKIP